MKNIILTFALIYSTSVVLFTQETIPASIIMKEGESIMAHHFGQKECDGNEYYTGYIMLKGKYMDMLTEVKDYKDIRKLELIGFTKEPENSTQNEKAKIVVHKKNGITVTLEEAELILSCMGSDEMYNQIKVQVINPITEKISEKSINMMDIKMIVFQ